MTSLFTTQQREQEEERGAEVTTLNDGNARANQAWRELCDAVMENGPAFPSTQRGVFEEGWETGYKAKAAETQSVESSGAPVLDREAAHEKLTEAFMRLRERSGGCPNWPNCAACRVLAGDEATTALDALLGLFRSEAEVNPSGGEPSEADVRRWKAEALREAAEAIAPLVVVADEWLRERADELEERR